MKNNYTKKTKTDEIIWLLQSGFFLLALLVLSMQNANAQLSGWQYKDGINVHENSGTQKLNYQVLLTVNTAALVTPNKMNVKGNDIRFSKDCNGSVLLNYFLDSLTMNTANTKIWVMLDTLKPSGNYLMYMWYGNSTATAASNFNNTFPVSTQLIVPTGTVTLTGANNYSWFEIQNGATVVVGPNSPFSINARMIRITGTLNGNGAGFIGGAPNSNGSGPGGGKVSVGNLGTYGAGGGSYGGVGGQGGGAGAGVGQPGAVYGTLNTDSIDMGSGGGGAASGGAGGAGGGGITLIGDVIDIQGTVSADGSDGLTAVLDGAGGGGSGGGIKIKGNVITFNGILSAKGGNGQPGGYGSGGGGGGRIKIFKDVSLSNTGITAVTGGAPGASNGETVMQTGGANGTTFLTGTWLSKVPTFSFAPHVTLTSSTLPICEGSIATFTASTGFTPYKFYVDTTVKQNGASTTYSSSTLVNNNKVKVLAGDANGCFDTSNVIIVTVNPKPTVTLSPATTICNGNSTPLTASGGTTYSWGPATGLSSTSGSSVTASPTATTQYTVIVTDANSCQNSDTVTVTVNGCTGIHQNAGAFDFHSYPNPNHGMFTIVANFADGKEVSISLCNVIGETIKTIDSGNFAGTYKKDVSMNDVPDGVYFLTLKTKDSSQIKKIIKN